MPQRRAARSSRPVSLIATRSAASGEAASRATSSGPTPAGSPLVMARRGRRGVPLRKELDEVASEFLWLTVARRRGIAGTMERSRAAVRREKARRIRKLTCGTAHLRPVHVRPTDHWAALFEYGLASASSGTRMLM